MGTANSSFHISLQRLAVVAILLLLPALVAAQGGRGQGVDGPVRKPAPRDQPNNPSVRERQFRMLEMELEAANARTPEEQKLALEQIAEDYKQIQLINNKMMAASIPAREPNFLNISQSLSEIRKLANRLRNNLRLPNVETDAKDEYQRAVDTARLKSNLLALDKSIMTFVGNAIFKNPDVMNLEEAKNARRELETIIRNSQLIAKDAEVLNKSSAK
ncbi:MAG TPA: hypothetical protein VJV03_01100 [Pyrinomonadaceae bacterium]|nr:hypothetical protein [Pyrinomonadaceae bacterium]